MRHRLNRRKLVGLLGATALIAGSTGCHYERAGDPAMGPGNVRPDVLSPVEPGAAPSDTMGDIDPRPTGTLPPAGVTVPVPDGRPPAPTPPVPAAPVAPAPEPAAPATTATPTQYTIQPGDNLWKIALKHYGDGQKWKAIAAANPTLDPNKVQAGKTIVLP